MGLTTIDQAMKKRTEDRESKKSMLGSYSTGEHDG